MMYLIPLPCKSQNTKAYADAVSSQLNSVYLAWSSERFEIRAGERVWRVGEKRREGCIGAPEIATAGLARIMMRRREGQKTCHHCLDRR